MRKVYAGSPIVEETRTDGWCYGAITEFEDPAGCTDGDGYVEAPDGSRAGLDWVVRRNVRVRCVFPPDKRQWGIYEASFPKPVRNARDLARCFRLVLPRLKKLHARLHAAPTRP